MPMSNLIALSFGLVMENVRDDGEALSGIVRLDQNFQD